MVIFDPSFQPAAGDGGDPVPLGIDPAGAWIVTAEDLPALPIPRRVLVVTRQFIEIDCWVFPLCPVRRSLLVWLHQSFLRWIEQDGSARNKRWVEGIVDVVEKGLNGEPEAGEQQTTGGARPAEPG
jgi:hypothetical protein